MKKRTMKKMGSFILACLMVVSTFSTLSTVAYAESNSYKTKIHETFDTLDSEELAALTADPTTYDISVFIEFESSAEELAALMSDDPVEQRERGKTYHSNKNKKIKEALELENAYVSNLAPFAEITYDSLSEYEAAWKQIRSIAKSDLVKDIDVLISNIAEPQTAIDQSFSISETSSTRSNDLSDEQYTLEEVYESVGLTNNQYTGDGIYVGVVEKELPDSTAHISPENYESYGSSSDANIDDAHHARLVTSLIGGTYGIAEDVTFLCTATSSLGYVGAIDLLIDEWYVQIVNVSMSIYYEINSQLYTGYYDNISAYIDYLSNMYNSLFVIAAGNRGMYTDKLITIPGCSANAITVGSMNKDNQVSAFSSFLYSASPLLKPDMVAPGENILFHESVYNGSSSGTSFAAPIVSGIAIKLMSEFSILMNDVALLKAVLIQSCNKISNQTNEHDVYAGAGCVNYSNARQIMLDENYHCFVKSASTNDGDFVGFGTITIPAHSKMHLYVQSTALGINTEEFSHLPNVVDVATYKISIGIGTTLVDYTSNYIVFSNNTDEDLAYGILIYVIEDNLQNERETIAVAYDFEALQ